jgi:hypothetical protein
MPRVLVGIAVAAAVSVAAADVLGNDDLGDLLEHVQRDGDEAVA